jgi:hypothetical protein
LLLDDGSLNLVLQSSDLAAIDREILTVTGLSGDRYSLTIDGTKIAEFTRRQLDSGVNLALYNSPIEGQANTIEWTTSDRAQLSNTWYQLMSEDKLQPDQQSTAQGLETLDAELIEREYRAAQPLPHTFELVSIASQ